MPEFLMIDGLRINFISFQEVSQNQIERYIVQPWAGASYEAPDRILTMFGKNGTTYLVKARYDGQ